MKYKVLVIGFILALGGCAPLEKTSFEEAYMVVGQAVNTITGNGVSDSGADER